jgi:L-lactate utilization protein LutB
MMVDQWYNKTLGERTRDTLRKNGFIAEYFEGRAEAMQYITGHFTKDIRIGFGGSVTTTELGLKEAAHHRGAVVIDHHKPEASVEERFLIMREQLVSDLFISSSNAVTEKGEIVNVDHVGNRVASLIFGPRKTMVVIGVNKIVADLDEAWARIARNASPKNNKRLGRDNPCAKTGYCVECQNDTRICRSYTVIRKKPAMSDFHVVIIGEKLGF